MGTELREDNVDEVYQQVLRQAPHNTRVEGLAAVAEYFDATEVEVTGRKLSLICPVSWSRIALGNSARTTFAI